jgi:hypothetical protein
MKNNIFQILSSGNLELTHSAMIRLLLDREIYDGLNENQDLIKYFFNKTIENSFKIELEQSFKLNYNGKDKRIRFDILFVGEPSEDKKKPILGVIENKFKATPTKTQLEMYDSYLTQHGYMDLEFKILLVFDINQVPSDVKKYADDKKWNIIGYFGTIGILDNLNKLESEISIKDESIRVLIHNYVSYLNDIESEINEIKNSPIYISNKVVQKQTASILSHREIYFRYLLYIQSELSNLAGLEKFFVNQNFDFKSDNDGGKNNIPSVAFWFSGNSFKAVQGVTNYYFGIDGDSMKIGIQYNRKNTNELQPFIAQISESLEQTLKCSALSIEKNTRSIKSSYDEKKSNNLSVFSIFTFKLKSDNELKDQVLKDLENIIVNFHNLISQ